ncbi:MAG: hypothetical protein R2838_20425 [Caldilineaceae bacterium]
MSTSSARTGPSASCPWPSTTAYKRVFKDAGGETQTRQPSTAETPDEDEIELTKEQRAAHRLHGQRQDAVGPDVGALSQRPVHHCRHHFPHRGRLRGRRRGDDPGQAAQSCGVGSARAAYGIVYIDRIDRSRKNGDNEHHPGRERRGRAAGAAQDYRGGRWPMCRRPARGANIHSRSSSSCNTANVLFICGGAFAHLAEVVRKRLQQRSSIGFVNRDELTASMQLTQLHQAKPPRSNRCPKAPKARASAS